MMTVFDYGATGDGVADDTAAFQAAAAAGNLHAPYARPDGETATYLITDTVNIPGGRVVLDGTVDARQVPAGHTLGERIVFRAWGGVGESTSLTSRVFKGRSVLTMPNDFSPGDVLIISSDERPVSGMTRSDRSKGELKRVISADAETVRMSVRTYFDYQAPVTITPIQAVDVRFSGSGTILCGGEGSGHTAIGIRYAMRPVVRDLTIVGAEDVGVDFSYSWAPYIENVRVEDSTSPSYANTGYGVLFGAGIIAGYATGCMFFNCRHGFAGGGTIPSMYCTVDRCFTDNALLDSHEPTFEWQFFGNTIMGGDDGMLIRGQNADAILNRFFSVGCGVRVKTWDGVDVQDGVRSLFNRVRVSNRQGVVADGRAEGAEPISRKPGLELIGDRVEESGSPDYASVTVAHATESVVNVTTRRNIGAKGVDILSSRLRELIALADDASTPVSLSDDSSVKRD